MLTKFPIVSFALLFSLFFFLLLSLCFFPSVFVFDFRLCYYCCYFAFELLLLLMRLRRRRLFVGLCLCLCCCSAVVLLSFCHSRFTFATRVAHSRMHNQQLICKCVRLSVCVCVLLLTRVLPLLCFVVVFTLAPAVSAVTAAAAALLPLSV